jgi:hypothetical protein
MNLMVHRVLVSCSFICCALVIASFGFFAIDQLSGASSQQVAQVTSGSPVRPSSSSSATHHGAVRRFVDQAAKDLTYPFHSLATSSSQWGNQLLLLVIALAIYGVGLGYLARYASGSSQ